MYHAGEQLKVPCYPQCKCRPCLAVEVGPLLGTWVYMVSGPTEGTAIGIFHEYGLGSTHLAATAIGSLSVRSLSLACAQIIDDLHLLPSLILLLLFFYWERRNWMYVLHGDELLSCHVGFQRETACLD